MSRKGDFRYFSSAAKVSELWLLASTSSQLGEETVRERREAFVVGNGFGSCGGAGFIEPIISSGYRNGFHPDGAAVSFRSCHTLLLPFTQ